jgi:hypothetical protein
MKLRLCGELGFTNADGQPCGYRIGPKAKACPHHGGDPSAARKFQLKGAAASQATKALPVQTDVPVFESPEAVAGWCREMAKTALTRPRVDLKRLAEARQFGGLALTALQLRTQQQLVVALSRLEHGQTAVILLEQMQRAVTTGRLRPLPGRRLLEEKDESDEHGESTARPA